MSTPPKRDARTVLFTGGLLLVPLAALWLLLDPAHSFRHVGGSAPRPGDARTGGADGGGPGEGGVRLPPAPPAWPPPRVAAGTPTQADWTLLAVTLAPWDVGFQVPPAPLAPPPGGGESAAVARNPFLQASPGAVELWIGVRGGVGVKTLLIPQDGRRHEFPFGRFTLVAQPQPSPVGGSFVVAGGSFVGGGPPGGGGYPGGGSSGLGGGFPVGGGGFPVGRSSGTIISNGVAGVSTLRWERAGGPDPSGQVAHGPDPYRIQASFPARPGLPAAETVMLTPTPFSAGFRVTALPLSADGRPTGKAVALLCQPVTASALLAQIPAGYNAQTRQFRVTVARAVGKSKGGGASALPPCASPRCGTRKRNRGLPASWAASWAAVSRRRSRSRSAPRRGPAGRCGRGAGGPGAGRG